MSEKTSLPGGTLMEVLAFTAEQTRALADANGVLGDPVVIDGVTVIPVSKVSAGFAGGGADIKSEKKSQSPAGVGAHVTRTPVTFLVIQDGRVERIAVTPEEPSLPMDLARMAVDKFKEWTHRK